MGLFFVFITSVLVHATRADLGDDYARASLRLGLAVGSRVIAAHPPREHVYLCVGRSPAILAAQFDELATLSPRLNVRKVDLPLSGLGGPDFAIENYDATLHRHIDRALATAGTLGHRRILFIDYAATGASFDRLARVFARYARARGLTSRFEGLVLRVDPDLPVVQKPPVGLVAAVAAASGLKTHEIVLDADEWLVFQRSQFKDHAPHGEFAFRDKVTDRPAHLAGHLDAAAILRPATENPPDPNPLYQNLCAAVRAIYREDACERELRVLPPPPWEAEGAARSYDR